MKIAIVSDSVYPYHKGGKERRFFEISTRLARRGHEVTIYCMKWWSGPEKTRVENGVRLRAISPLYPLYSGSRRSIRQGVLFGLNCLRLLFEKWDVIEVDHMPYFPLYFTRIVCWLKGKKMYATWNEVWGRRYWVRYMDGLSGLVGYIIERCGVMLPDFFISISEHTSERLRSVYKIPASKIQTVSAGLDVEAIKVLDKAVHSCDILYAGRLLKHKNVATLIQATALLKENHPQIRVFIVGNGPEKQALIKLTARLGLERNVLFFSFLPHHHEVFELMKSARVFCLPSTREGFGMTVLEANACGIPAIVARHPENAAQDLIEGPNGVLVDPTPEGIAAGYEHILAKKNDPEEIMRIAEKYSWERIVSRLEKVYDPPRNNGVGVTMNLDVTKA